MRARSGGAVVVIAVGFVVAVAVPAHAGARSPHHRAATAAAAPTPSAVTWTATEVPLPGTTATESGQFGAMACPASGTCVMVGSYGTTSDPFQSGFFIDELAGGGWATSVAPLPADEGTPFQGQLQAMACPAVGSCLAVGNYQDTSGSFNGLVETQTGDGWTPTTLPLPENADPATGGDGDAGFLSIACWAVGSCVAVGYYYDTTGNEQGLIETLADGSWSDSEVPYPANAVPFFGEYRYLNGVSCPAPGSCVAVGTYTARGNRNEGLITTLSKGSWTATEAPLPHSYPPRSIILTDVTCPTPQACTAIGWNNGRLRSSAVVESLSRGTWTPTVPPLPPGGHNFPTPILNDPDCLTAGFCEVVGEYGNGLGLIDTLSQGSWRAIRAPLPANAAASHGSGQLIALGCEASDSCVAVGDYNVTDVNAQMRIETLNHDQWTASEAPVPAGAGTVTNFNADGVACPPLGPCVLVGDYDTAANNDEIAVETSS